MAPRGKRAEKNRSAPRKVVSTEVVEPLGQLYKFAQDGDLVDLFFVARHADGEYADGYVCDDLNDMLLEVGSAKIRARTQLVRAELSGEA